jgi:hypothetical protein
MRITRDSNKRNFVLNVDININWKTSSVDHVVLFEKY